MARNPFGRRGYGTPVPPGQRRALEILPKRPTDGGGAGWWLRDPGARLRLMIFAALSLLLVGSCSIVFAPPPPPVYLTGYEAIGLGEVRFERPKTWTPFYGDQNLDRPTVFIAPQTDPLLPPTAISLYSANVADLYREIAGTNPGASSEPQPTGTQWSSVAMGDGAFALELPAERAVDVIISDGRTWTVRRATPDSTKMLFSWSDGLPTGSVDTRLGAAAKSIPALCGAATGGSPQELTLASGVAARLWPLATGLGWGGVGVSGATDRMFLFCFGGNAVDAAAWIDTLRLQEGASPLVDGPATVMPGRLAPLPSVTPGPAVDTLSREEVLRALVARWVAEGKIPAPAVELITYSSGDAAGLQAVGLRLRFPGTFPYLPARPGNTLPPTPAPSPSLGPDGRPLPTPDPDSGPLRDYPSVGKPAEGLAIRQELVIYLPSAWSFSNPGVGQRALVIALSYHDGLEQKLLDEALAAFEQVLATLVISG